MTRLSSSSIGAKTGSMSQLGSWCLSVAMPGNGVMFQRLNGPGRGHKRSIKLMTRRAMVRLALGPMKKASPQEWRPLPRRDMTTRDDYHAVDAVNRHVITPLGWVHEQDNSKLMLDGTPQVLVREVGVNTYQAFDDYPVEAAEAYWEGTSDFWAGVRAHWTKIEAENDRFAITIKGETEALYMPLLELAIAVKDGETDLDPALEEARAVIDGFVTPNIGLLTDRLRPATKLASLD